ncbi:MAG: HAD-IB family phosphatase [Desulfurococcus sp.]|nr:HAD-IB family phosphatase [Desulfurococcus sp.]
MPRRLVVFDCDGVLTEDASSWEVMHKYFGSRSSRYFEELYRRNLISYLDWMKIDVALMISAWGKPITRMDVERVLSSIKVRPEARRVVDALRNLGYTLAVVSSGIDILVERVCRELGIEMCFYNKLRFHGDELIPGGEALVPLKEKPSIIVKLAKSLSIEPENVYYIGDSEWDIEVFKVIENSIALKPCGNACMHAKHVVASLEDIISILRE